MTKPEPQKYYLLYSYSRWENLDEDGKSRVQKRTYYLSKLPPPRVSPFEYSSAPNPLREIVVYVE